MGSKLVDRCGRGVDFDGAVYTTRRLGWDGGKHLRRHFGRWVSPKTRSWKGNRMSIYGDASD